MKYYGKKFLRRSIDRLAESKIETRDGLLFDVDPINRVCRVKIQGSNRMITAHYPENWEQTPVWLKPGNSVRIVHQSGIRGRIEVVGHGQTQPTGVGMPVINYGDDTTLVGCRLVACEVPRMAVLVRL